MDPRSGREEHNEGPAASAPAVDLGSWCPRTTNGRSWRRPRERALRAPGPQPLGKQRERARDPAPPGRAREARTGPVEQARHPAGRSGLPPVWIGGRRRGAAQQRAAKERRQRRGCSKSAASCAIPRAPAATRGFGAYRTVATTDRREESGLVTDRRSLRRRAGARRAAWFRFLDAVSIVATRPLQSALRLGSGKITR